MIFMVDPKGIEISIHALREERDLIVLELAQTACDFNPRAPRGARRDHLHHRPNRADFNPRAPRGARLFAIANFPCVQMHFNPRAPRGARHRLVCIFYQHISISIHALREERDMP